MVGVAHDHLPSSEQIFGAPRLKATKAIAPNQHQMTKFARRASLLDPALDTGKRINISELSDRI
jgi:hypothetical protein